MPQVTTHATVRKLGLFGATALAAALSAHALAQTPAPAQAAAAPAPAAETAPEAEETVVVTGSRLRRAEKEVLQPTVVTTEADIEKTGLDNLGNFLRSSPLFQAYDQQTGDRSTANVGDVGVTFPNLYNLGSQRTLTLINGRRSVGASSPNGSGANGLQVDVSSIPVGLIKRVETISVGGAPIYGSDAIAGTVNIILKDDYEGISAEGWFGQTFEGDGVNGRAQFLFGRNFDDGRGNITISAAYQKQDAITAADVGFDVPSGFVGSIASAAVNVPVRGGSFIFVSGFGRPSAFFGLGGLNPTTGAPTYFYLQGGQPLTFDARGNLVTFTTGPGAGAVAAGAVLVTVPPGSDTDSARINYSLLQPSERLNFSGSGNYKLMPNLTAWTRFSYSETTATQIGAPPNGSPLNATAEAQAINVPISHPFLRPAVRQFFTTNLNGTGGTTAVISREYRDVTDGSVTADQSIWTFQAGLEGDFKLVNRNFDWDLTFSRGKTTREQTGTSIVSARLRFANDPVYTNPGLTAIVATPATLNPDNFVFDPAAGVYRENGTGNLITCRVRLPGSAPAGANALDVSACIPYNPMGAQNPGAALNYLRATQFQKSVIDQTFVQGNISTELFQLPAGPLQIAAGFEWREEKSSFDLDGATKTGILFGGQTGAPVTGSFRTTEFYAETRIPVLNGEMMKNALGFALIDSFEIEASARTMDNSFAGRDEAWTLGARLGITEDILFRGNLTQSVRQPAVGEIFAGTEPRRQSITDPCAVGQIDAGPVPATRRANCVAAVVASGLAATPAAATTFLATFTTPLAGINGTFSGNTSLQSEEANSWTAGVVLTPRFLPGFFLSADYVDIKIENVIQAINGTQLAQSCFDSATLTNIYCARITRGPTFAINGFQAFNDNVGRREFAAWTLNARYAFSLDALAGEGRNFGDVTLGLQAYFLQHDRSGLPGRLVDSKGAVGFEDTRLQFSLDYVRGPFSFGWRTAYYSESKVDPNNAALFNPNDVSSYTLSDVNLGYEITDNVRVSFVMTNVFDKKPPVNGFGFQFDQIGRRFVAGINLDF